MRDVEFITCDICGNRATIPPGKHYRGGKYCPHHAARIARRDFTDEVVAPMLDAQEEMVESYFENMDEDNL